MAFDKRGSGARSSLQFCTEVSRQERRGSAGTASGTWPGRWLEVRSAVPLERILDLARQFERASHHARNVRILTTHLHAVAEVAGASADLGVVRGTVLDDDSAARFGATVGRRTVEHVAVVELHPASRHRNLQPAGRI